MAEQLPEEIQIAIKLVCEEIVKIHKQEHTKLKSYWSYYLFTPWYIRLWHKITFKDVPKL